MKARPTFTELVGALMVIAATAAIIIGSLVMGRVSLDTALVAISSAGVGYFLRSKVQTPTPPP